MRRATSALVVALLTLFAPDASAQTAQKFSVQVSALGVQLTKVENEDLAFGRGGEIQVRWNPSAFSLGIGAQTTVHDLANISVTYRGGFVEPRYILGSLGNSVGLYASARLMSLSATFDRLGLQIEVNGVAISGGGGLLIRLASRLNADLGVTVGKEFYDGNAADGSTVVTRIGLALGL
jgi:hypothetical protein